MDDLGRSAITGGIAYFAIVTVLVLLLEARRGEGLKKYRSPEFLNDVIYTLFYRGGIYGVAWGATFNVLEEQLSWLRIESASQLPLWIQIALFWLLGDFIIYWVHRLQHSNRFLWAFHSVHHAPTRLNTLTQSRRHLVERVFNDVCLLVPLLVILGIPTAGWPLLWMMFGALEAFQHAELDWRFGPLYYVLVSPVFHAAHHSNDPAHYDKNLSGMFSFWDFLFGTAVDLPTRPTEYGVPDSPIRESLGSQIVEPFRIVSGRPSSRPDSDPDTPGA